MTSCKKILFASLTLFALTVPATEAAAEGLIAHVTSVSTDNNATNRQIFIQVDGGKTCTGLAGNAFIRWRLAEVPKNYEEGVSLLISALLSHAPLVLDVTNVSGVCRLNSFIVGQP